jgi:tetratricopeptide (TPR) repeat protein
MKRVLLLAFTLILTTGARAQQDSVAFRAANALGDASGKLRALEEFVGLYPTSTFLGKAYDALFELYLDQGKETSALNAAAHSLGTVPPENRSGPYNRFAFSLATRNMGLDTALVYINRAERLAEESKSRSLPAIQDTKAYVLYRLGRFAEAEQLQRVAIKGNEDDPEYLAHLALYEHGNGRLQDALRTLARALYLGAGEEYKGEFLGWISEAESEVSQREELKRSVVMTTIYSFTDSIRGPERIAANSSAAGLMADLGVDLPLAREWAEAGFRTLQPGSSVAERVTVTRILAMVLAAQGNRDQALSHLNAISDLVDPYDTAFWKLLGNTRLLAGDTTGAIEARMQGLLAMNETQLRSSLESLYVKHHGSTAGLNQSLDSLRLAGASFEPGKYGKSAAPQGKVILAELFTGAECGPCAGSDLAFDALAAYYPRSVLAILEYHVHIPGPDPMTTNESWDRYTWYAGQGTPTAVFEGTESMIGGGPKLTAKNRFHVYRYAIRKSESAAPAATLVLAVHGRGDSVLIEATVSPTVPQTDTTKPALHIALVERSVAYTGPNGIPVHAFVVRSMVEGAAGLLLSWVAAGETVRKVIHIADVERAIREYLDNPLVQPSWPKRRTTFAGWRARPDQLDRSDLAIVAWVQDPNTKEVLQAAYQDITFSRDSR